MKVSWQSEFKGIAARYTDDLAISSGARSIAFKPLFDGAAGLANCLAACGLGPNASVAAMIPNSIEAVSASIGITLSGCIEVPINPALSPAERTWCLELAQVKDLVTVKDVPLDGVPAHVRLHFIEDIVPSDIEDGEWSAPNADQWSRILFTSGTTGRPKGVVHTQNARWLANILLAMSLPFRPSRDDKILLMTPFSHGTSLMTYAFFASGAPIHLTNGVQMEEVLGVIRNGSVRHIFAPPTVLSKIVSALSGEMIGTIRTIFTGTAPLSSKLYAETKKVFGPVVRVTYGMTELFNPITVLEPAECDVAYTNADGDAAGWVGWPAPGVEISIRQEDGSEVEPGTTGEVHLRGRHMYCGYLLAEGFRPLVHGSFHPTGDVGYLDPKRGLRLMARRHDIIKTGGYKIFPQEIEEGLLKTLAGGEILVVGIPSEYWGEIILVAGEDQLGQWESRAREAAQFLTVYKRPRLYVAMSALPRNATGKLDRKRLKQIVAEQYRLVDGPHPQLTLIN